MQIRHKDTDKSERYTEKHRDTDEHREKEGNGDVQTDTVKQRNTDIKIRHRNTDKSETQRCR